MANNHRAAYFRLFSVFTVCVPAFLMKSIWLADHVLTNGVACWLFTWRKVRGTVIGRKFTRFQLLFAWFGTQKQYLNLASVWRGISKKIALVLSHQKSLVQICCPRFWRWNLCRWPWRYAWRVDTKEGHSSSDSRGSVSCHSAARSRAALAAMVIQWDYRWRHYVSNSEYLKIIPKKTAMQVQNNWCWFWQEHSDMFLATEASFLIAVAVAWRMLITINVSSIIL